MRKYILAIDQSTFATKVILFDRKGKPQYRNAIPHQQYYPQEGFVEHNPCEILNNTFSLIVDAIKVNGITEADLASIAITNQRETVVIWDKYSGKPVYNAAVWQCQRGSTYCNIIREQGKNQIIKEKTGLLTDPYFSAGKLHWIMNQVEGLKEKAKKGELLAGTIDSWLLWNLTGKRIHATDYSNACRTMLFNIHTLQWDEELLDLFGLQRSMFPEVKFSDEIFGYTDIAVLKSGIPVSGLAGDSHAALFGQNCFTQGMAKATYGTGSSIMMNIGSQPLEAPDGLVTSVGYAVKGKIQYVFEGNIHCTGDTINWLKNEVQLIGDASETEPLATSVPDNGGVYLVPAFVGLGAPYWDNKARACLSSMSRNTTKAHIIRAALESIAYQIRDLIGLMEEKGGIGLHELRVDGGPTRNDFLMQFQCDLLNRVVVPSGIEEVSALGSAFMAGLATGFWKDLEEIQSLRETNRSFSPAMDQNEACRLYEGWKKAIERARL
ncbi:MAG: glycerol kinase GlpK [Mangrovibacterium sp.]